MATIREAFGLFSNIKSPDFLAGMECEIEGLTAIKHDTLLDLGWSVTEDGSLRNNGQEFISVPSSLEELVEKFKGLHTVGIKTSGEAFSERTSIHVHVNCLDLELSRVKNIMLWYALFEPYFFSLVKPERVNNIFCVQLSQTVLPDSYKQQLKALVHKWSKYTALNLLPLAELGTIEFRHMHGTNDPVVVEQWLRTIKNLWEFGQKVQITRKLLIKPEEVKKAFNYIFKDVPTYQDADAFIGFNTQNSIIDVKLGLM